MSGRSKRNRAGKRELITCECGRPASNGVDICDVCADDAPAQARCNDCEASVAVMRVLRKPMIVTTTHEKGCPSWRAAHAIKPAELDAELKRLLR